MNPNTVLSLDQDKCLEIAKSMRDKDGLKIGDKRYFFCVYEKSFVGSEAVDWMCKKCGVTREEGVSIGQALVDLCVFHHISDDLSRRKPFMDGHYFYRFQEDEYSNVLNRKKLLAHDIVTDPCDLSTSLLARMIVLLTDISKASIYIQQADIQQIQENEDFKRIALDISDLQRVDIKDLSENHKLIFWVNVYNLLALHAALDMGVNPNRKAYFNEPSYIIQNQTYSLDDIQHGILRANYPKPLLLPKRHFTDSDPRAIFAMDRPAPIAHLFLACNTLSSPTVFALRREYFEDDITWAAKEFCTNHVIVSAEKLVLPRVVSLYRNDFGRDELSIWTFFKKHLSEQQALLTQKPQIRFSDAYDWMFCFPKFSSFPNS